MAATTAERYEYKIMALREQDKQSEYILKV